VTEVDYQSSLVDGIGAPVVFPEMFDLARHLVDGSIVTTVTGVAGAIRLLLERQHVVAEGAGAAPVAAALTGEAGTGKIACVVSGRNIDPAKLMAIAAGGTP
jgi:threonine dehydratase